MKNEKIYDGITDIRDEIIVRASGHVFSKKKPFSRKLVISSIAAVLVIALVLTAVLDLSGNENVAPVYAIAEARYPEMAPYPTDYGDENAYEEWGQSIIAQRRPEGYADGLDEFFSSGIRQFLSDSNGENRVYSPLSVYMALAMLAELTEGESRQQILDLLCSESIESVRKQASDVWNANYRDDGAVASVLANSLWLNENIDFVQSTMDTLAADYYASSYMGQMGSDEISDELHDWLNAQTGGMLEEQVSGIELTSDTVLALASTVYFGAKWTEKYSPEDTKAGTFHAYSGDVTCDFMSNSIVSDYYWGDRFTAAGQSLEYGRMIYLLPDEGVSVDELLSDEQTMEFITDIANWENCKGYQTVNLSVPKFDVSSQMDLRAGLKALGVTDVFDSELSDFSPMTRNADEVYLSKVQHDARVMIDEEGCTAAAYTMMIMEGTGGLPDEEVDFVLDRPFIFVIVSSDGLPLFTGVVNQPM